MKAQVADHGGVDCLRALDWLTGARAQIDDCPPIAKG
jgi:hypothetical protein